MIVPVVPANKVGVAPGTTAFALNGTQYVDCPADAARIDVLKIPTNPGYRNPPKGAAVQTAANALRRVQRALSPYGTFENMSGALGRGLGIVLAPYGDISPEPPGEIAATMQNWRTRCGPNDPQFNTRGEAGYYYDGLAGVAPPGDLEMSRIYGYTPVVNSWVPFKKLTWTMAPWVPRSGYEGQGYPTIGPALRGAADSWSASGVAFYQTMTQNMRWAWSALLTSTGLGDATSVSAEIGPITLDPAQEAVLELKKHQERVFMLSTISTAAIAMTTGIGLIKFLRDERRAKKGGKATEHATSALPISGARRRRRR